MSGSRTWEAAVQSLREDPARSQLVRACYYDDPLLAAACRFHLSTEWAEVRRLLAGTVGRRVVDVGAGRGISSFAFARDGWRVIAVDPDPSPLVGCGAIRSLAREAALEIEVLQSRGESVPLPDGSTDVVYLRQALHHAANLNAMVQECYRVLVPGGRILASREHVISRASDLEQFLRSHPLHSLYGGEHAYTLVEYRSAFLKAGFCDLKIFPPRASALNGSPTAVTRKSFGRCCVEGIRWPIHAIRDRVDQSPGRLNSFLAVRP